MAAPALSDDLPTPADRIRVAIWFAGQGFGVFPVWSVLEGRCRCPLGSTCTSPGKHPITPNGFKDATRDPDKIRTFLSAGSNPNYGMLPPEGVFVWDCDTDDERARIATLEARYGPLPPTMRVSTAHGQHILWRWPEGLPRPIHKMFGMVTRWGSGAAAGYIVGPLSVHVSGKVYRSAPESATEIAELPESWARGAVEQETQTITVTGPRQPEDIAVGGRHDFLRDTARHFAGTVRDPHALFAAVWAVNQRMPVPKTQEEVQRAIGEALTRFPADPVEEDPETGETRVVRGEEVGLLALRSEDDLFPPPVPRVAFDGLLGQCVDAILPGTDASDVGILASLIAFCGVLMPATGYFQGTQTSTPFIGLVGTTGDGRKGTAMNRAKDALSLSIQANDVNSVLLDGINSGEGLVKAIMGRRAPATGLLFEEEYANLLASQGREGSTLDTKMRVAFDGRQLSNRKVKDSDSVSDYWLSGLVAVTPDELRSRMPVGFMKSGSGNRWLWVPIKRRPVVSLNQPPILPMELSVALVDAFRECTRKPPLIETDQAVSDILAEYDAFLRAGAVGTEFNLTRRYPAIAYRIALVHASVERSRSILLEHAHRALALAEYARSGIEWVFGKSVGDADTTLLARHLETSKVLTNTVISKHLIRIPSRRQAAVDDLQRLGVATVRTVGTKGRSRTELVWVERPKANFGSLVALIRDFVAEAPERDPTLSDPFSQDSLLRGNAETDDLSVNKRVEGGNKVRESGEEGAQKSAEDPALEAVDTSTGEIASTTTGDWLRPCRRYSDHQDQHRNTSGGWICLACDAADEDARQVGDDTARRI